MEKKSRRCMHCHQSFTPTRNPTQRYCHQRICQNTRKNRWRKQKYAQDADYGQNQKCAEQRWRQQHPDYWKKYRAAHPDYVHRNRVQQFLRQRQRRLDQKNTRQEADVSLFANSDASPHIKFIKSGTYHMIPVTRSEFANSDALLVNIAVVTRG